MIFNDNILIIFRGHKKTQQNIAVCQKRSCLKRIKDYDIGEEGG